MQDVSALSLEFNVPLNPGTKFRSYAEEWEVVKDKRTRYSKEVREKSKAKYIGMYLLDEDDEEHPKRVIKRMAWHKDRRATAAGWTVDTVDADSHDNWAAYHVLKAHGQKLVEGDLFADIQRATDRGLNKHRTVVSKEDEKKSEEEKRKRENEKRKKREEEGEEGEGEEYE